MANLKLQNNSWEAIGVYDIDQQKNQRQINAEVSDLKNITDQIGNAAYLEYEIVESGEDENQPAETDGTP